MVVAMSRNVKESTPVYTAANVAKAAIGMEVDRTEEAGENVANTG
jgi:hypothetical protein